MSTSAHKDIHATPQADNWQPRPELLRAMREIATIADGDDTAVITDRTISFANIAQRTTSTASEVDLVTVHGLTISERIDIRTPLPEFADMSLEQIATANMMATTGAIVLDPATNAAVLASSLTVFEVDTEALEDLYTPLVANAALAQLFGPLAVVDKIMGSSEFAPDRLGIPRWDEPSYWSEEEFDYAANIMRQAGIYCNAGASGLAAEFPWEEGACSAMVGDCTSLLQFSSDNPHPVAGNGLFFRLDLPVTLECGQLAEMANVLNVVEMNGVDTPPFFGAWCSQLDNGTLTFVGFWPNCLYRAGTVANIASWCRLRSRIARQVIGNH